MRVILVLLFATLLSAKDVTGLQKYGDIVKSAIKKSSGKQKVILQNALNMVKNKEIVVGSCWDYINRVYTKSKAKRVTIFSSKKGEKYFNKELLKPADWIYHINYSFKNVGHSGMFIDWVDKNKTKALMLSYAGEKKKLPARFRIYNIKSIYNVYRAKENLMDNNYIPLKEYAIKNKISIFNAMKLANSGKVESIKKTIDGKEQIFIKSDANVTIEPKEQKEPTIKELLKEIEELKRRVEVLEKRLDKK